MTQPTSYEVILTATPEVEAAQKDVDAARQIFHHLRDMAQKTIEDAKKFPSPEDYKSLVSALDGADRMIRASHGLVKAKAEVAKELRLCEEATRKRFREMSAKEFREALAADFESWAPSDRELFLLDLSDRHARLSGNTRSATSSAGSPAMK